MRPCPQRVTTDGPFVNYSLRQRCADGCSERRIRTVREHAGSESEAEYICTGCALTYQTYLRNRQRSATALLSRLVLS